MNDRGLQVRILITAEDMIRVMDIARIALENRRIYDQMVSEMDVTDDELCRLYHKIMGFLEGELA